jgi:hypothetical protein
MRCTRATFQWLIISAALWAAVVVSGQELSRTQISDTLFNADGSRAEGSLSVSWQSFTAADGSTVPQNTISTEIVDGVAALSLAPNEGALPQGTAYRVRYRLRGSRPFTELWVIPDSTEPVSIAAIRVQSVPPVGTSVSMSQVSGLPAALSDKADRSGPNTFVAPQVLREDAPGSTNPLLGLQKSDGSAGVYFRLPALSGDVTYTLPPSDGAPNQALTTDGSGSLFWTSAVGGGAGSGSAYEVLQDTGSSVTQRTVANFTSGFVLSDNSGQLRTDIAPDFGIGAGTFAEGNDARLSDARTPLAHASTHTTVGGDALTPVSIGALGRTNDFMVGANSTVAVLKVQGASGQTAALQEWRDGAGSLAALVTASGAGFFREMGISAPTGGSTVSQFFEIGGLKKFALSATDGVLDVLRYDNAGSFLDRPLRVFRNGKIETTVSLDVTDATVGSGTLGLTGDYLELQGVAAPSNPAPGYGRFFLSSATGEVSVRKSSGAILSLEQGGGGGSSGFTDQGTYVDHSTLTDDVAIGCDFTGGEFAKLGVCGNDTSQPTHVVRMASGQTANGFEVRNFADEIMLEVTNEGSLSHGSGSTPFGLTSYTDDVAPTAPSIANQFTAYVDRSAGVWSWIVNGGSAQTALTVAGTQSPTNKTVDGNSNTIQSRRASDCTALADGVIGQVCADTDDGALFVCIPSAGTCDTAGEWKAQAGGGGCVVDSRVRFFAAKSKAGGFDEGSGVYNGAAGTADGLSGSDAMGLAYGEIHDLSTLEISHMIEDCYSSGDFTLEVIVTPPGSSVAGDATFDVDFLCSGSGDNAGAAMTDTGADIDVDMSVYTVQDIVILSQTFTPTGCAADEWLKVKATFDDGPEATDDPRIVGMRIHN